MQNAVDAVKIPVGITQSLHRLAKIKPNVVFSKGGFVSVPVVVAAAILRIPIVIHESDLTPGIATKIAARFAKIICLAFPIAQNAGKIRITGNPIRAVGDAERGRKFLKFGNERPILLVAGGSSGADFLNNLLAKTVGEIAVKMNIIWLTGRGKLSEKSLPGNVRAFEYLDAEYLDILAAADLVVSRAGAGALFEIAAHTKPSILIPLPAESSRGDQIENAQFFEKKWCSSRASAIENNSARFHKTRFFVSQQTNRDGRKSAPPRGNCPRKIPLKKIARIILETAS